MTSKEALEELLYYANLNFERENERKTEFANKIEQIGVADNEESFKIIEKDLEILEILKKYIYYSQKSHRIRMREIRKSIYNFDCEDLKEWLENIK